MTLDIEKIKEITCGAVKIEKEEDGIHFYRFTKEEENYYRDFGDEFYYSQVFATAGIKLVFKTDSEKLFIKGKVMSASARKYYSLDVIKNGEFLDSINNFERVIFSENFIDIDLPVGEFSKEVNIGKGEKEIAVYLPWSANCIINEISVDDGAFVEAVKYKKKMLFYGDSITQGYDALHPYFRYGSRLSEMLGAEEINKAIGGERFKEPFGRIKNGINPDIITVAYGTNDISCDGFDVTVNACEGFFGNITKNYPNAKIYAITPIWRGDYREIKDFEKLGNEFRNITSKYKNVVVIDGFDAVPKDKKYFADLFLHPTDEGFQYYAEYLYKKIADEENIL